MSAEVEAATSGSRRAAILVVGVLCAAAGLIGSASFLPHQALWNDEATQLSGLTLDPVEQVRWLAGRSDHDFGVPDDRMPPVSYWLGWGWSKAFGLDEGALRWMGAIATGFATLLVFLAAARAWGTASGIASALLFGLSPNVVVASVEIRAYPIFLLTSSALFYCLVRLLEDPPEKQAKWTALMTVAAVAGTYTHFFGLVAAGGAFLAALILAPLRGRSLAPILVGCAAVGLASLGLAPFVTASSEISSQAAEPSSMVKDLVKLVYRTFCHASIRMSDVATAAAFLGAALAGAASLAPRRRSQAAAQGLFIAWISGLAVVTTASPVVKFNSLGTSYNSWMLPLYALLLGSGIDSRLAWARRTSAAGVALLVAASLYGDYQLAVHGDSFGHTAHKAVDDVIRRFGPDRTALLHDKDDKFAWHIYSPLRYEYAGELAQYMLAGEREGRLRVADYPDRKRPEVDLASLPQEYLLVVQARPQSAEEVTRQLRQGVTPIADGPIARALKADSAWQLIEEKTALAYFAAGVDVFRRREPATPTAAPPPASPR